MSQPPHARVVARAHLPTRAGQFQIVAFETVDAAGVRRDDHVALVRGDVTGAVAPIPVRVHSECLTGDALGSLRCDCRDQLEMALAEVATMERGVILYLRQEGRGIGLANKVRAYALQEQGLDTVEANEHLGFDDDLRDYGVAAAMLLALGVPSIALYTNNPRKVCGLKKNGVTVAERRSLVARPTAHNAKYLATKSVKSGHLGLVSVESRESRVESLPIRKLS